MQGINLIGEAVVKRASGRQKEKRDKELNGCNGDEGGTAGLRRS